MTTAPLAARGGAGDVVSVLCLLQVGFLLLAGIGETVLMHNGLYLVLPLLKAVLLLVLAAKASVGRRWALVTLIVVQAVTLAGFWLQVAVGGLPWLDFTVNVVGLLTNVALPAVTVYLCATMLARSRRVAR